MTLSELGASPWTVRAIAFVWGCIWGSFVNVVVYRVPRAMSVVYPASHCPGCGAPIRPQDNVPVLSWLILRGRARCCGTAISPRYAVIELMAGTLAIAIAQRAFLTAPAEATVLHASAIFLANFGLAMGLLAAAFIDAEHMYLPDTITIGATLFGLATPGLRDLGWADAFFGAALGFGVIWGLFVVGYKALRGRAGMGLGDAKLVMLSGAWFGWRGVLFAIFGGALQASVAAVVVLVVRGKIEEPEAVRRDREVLQRAAADGDLEATQALEEDPLALAPGDGFLAARMPFGPFLCLATLEWMIAGDWIRDRVSWLGF